MVTEFEKILPLREISLVEFERRIKKLVTPSMSDSVSVGMLIECFKDHWAFQDIDKDDTLVFDLMFDEMFIYSEDRGLKAEHFDAEDVGEDFDLSDLDSSDIE